ncbi:MAG TPA: orotidine-5'-phosphate decarboxylase [Bacillota bacterium]|nr:orotidine-5'-phosphate decarboxylase [Bacillota bacterium]
MNFADRLQERIDALGNPSCLGLDPMLSYIPEAFAERIRMECGGGAGIVRELLARYCSALIDAVTDIIPAVKPQIAYFEQYGPEGILAFHDVVRYARRREMIVIVDAKRNDIGSTAEAYARAFLRESGAELSPAFNADALTVNGYLGIDGIRPFVDACGAEGRGIFVLCRTSNPSAGDLQDLKLADGRFVYEAMADLIHSWGEPLIGTSGFSSVGAVVGATWPEEARAIRKRLPHTFFLIPGYGAQGGKADGAVAGFSESGRGAVVNAARSLMLAWKKHNLPEAQFAEACRREALEMRDALRLALAARPKRPE